MPTQSLLTSTKVNFLRVRLFLLASMIGLYGCGHSAEVTSEKGRKCLDAIYTATTSRRPELLRQCETRVAELERSGELTPAVAGIFRGFIRKAESGEWQETATDLDQYIRAQSRH